ncbi:hypothetical protein NLJ89_g2929 [Agrocybe chaxingu]|uniref:Uncharacterized protein n=1 Tax=Agrocybe chaxingu TaxID=84603 RepID=A0A9W8K502_9AGAR|nr:hypothetical protein NLJ89_g2929 [Agrocybe chaxingu]
MSNAPLHKTRAVALIISWCFAVIASSVGLNALIKSNQEKSKLKRLAPSPTRVEIDTDDISAAGIVATTASLLIAVLASNFFCAMYLSFTKAFSARTLRLQGIILFVASLFLFGALVPYLVYFVNRHAVVSAFVGDTQLPDSVVKAVESASGSTSVYKDIYYLKLVAILPWFSLLFSLVASAILFKAGSSTPKPEPTPAKATDSSSASEKEDASHHEKVSV